MEENEILASYLYFLQKKYPNDMEFGSKVRDLLNSMINQQVDFKTLLSNLNSNI